MRGHRSFGVIGGLGPLASADMFFKLVKSTPATGDADHFDVVFEQHPFAAQALPAPRQSSASSTSSISFVHSRNAA